MERIRLITQQALSVFAGQVYIRRESAYRLWLVAPWIGYKDASHDPLLMLVDALRGRRVLTTAVTRKPREPWHADAVDFLKTTIKPIIYTCEELHTKLYMLECDDFRYALLGSPNLTPHANTHNREIAVEFRTTNQMVSGDVTRLMDQLTSYAMSLPEQSGVSLDRE